MIAECSHANRGPSTGWWRAQKSATNSQHAHTLSPSTVYTHIPHNATTNSKITPSPTTHKALKSPLQQSFGVRQDIYVIFTMMNILCGMSVKYNGLNYMFLGYVDNKQCMLTDHHGNKFIIFTSYLNK